MTANPAGPESVLGAAVCSVVETAKANGLL